ncbi:daunorubicin resistance protein DrrA family ABC transporter ATP-binding protein [Streptacidiphilus carbonis]|uniref:daunorubicin resistance protein DrrA family ABC transporter ATP-binding protein n=1 Tax=Streptacidiphilus carbonis TaxID=105422 RepID=UPI0005AB3305|nr:daunorubicin resistance protein DrrA family ABC transporter ATP-binding protein [Streptacidiphilus carbonis]
MEAAAELAIQATGLTKRFAATVALDGVDLTVPAGTIYGFLGPNGAGKTTTLRILATLLRADSGTARVLGHDVAREPDAVRARISLAGQSAALDEDLTARENLRVLGRLIGHHSRASRSRAQELLDAFGLADAADRPVKTWSGGMRRRLDLAASLIATPELLFLDEPTSGLDPSSRAQVWDTVRALAEAGTTVLLTTQYLDEADRLAARIAVIDHGTVIAEGTPGDLKAATGAGQLHVQLAAPEQAPQAAAALRRVLDLPVRPGTDPGSLSVAGPAADQAALAVAHLHRNSIPVAAFALARPSLDEVFLALTTRAADDSADPAKEPVV